MQPSDQGQGVFLNGKAQIAEMLKYMNENEREKLLHNIRLRNPQLAVELVERSLSFDQLTRFSDSTWQTILNYTNPQILGIALKSMGRDFQKRLLSIVDRNYAEKAYEILVTNLTNENRDITRAQNKILETVVNLNQRGLLQI